MVAAGLLATACISPAPNSGQLYQPPTAISVEVTMGQGALPADEERDLLTPWNTPAALLRRAWLELQLHQPRAALDATARVLFGTVKPTTNEECFARYLRAEAFALDATPERGTFDRERALQLALDPKLRQLLLAKVPATAAPSNTLASVDLAIQPRSAWHPAAAQPRNLDPMQKPSRVTIHHSAMYFRDTRPAACMTQIQQIQHEHMQGRGYGDIGYHFLIDPSGRIWEGRELKWQGAHANGDNNIGNIGICVLGNFMHGRGGQAPSPQQIDAMERLVLSLMQRYHFGPDAILCHSDLRATECPGPVMEGIVQQFAHSLQQGGSRIAAAAGH